VYRLTAPASLDSALVTVRGDDVTVDFTGATMQGVAPDARPDLASGVAIRIDGGHGIRIVGATVRGYKVAILARGTHRLDLVDNDLSYNWKPRLYSLVEHESLVDWLSFHHNETDEWLRYGAGAYLADVEGGEIRGNRVEQGMNGLLLVRSRGLRVWDNVLSYNSGVGIGLYRSTRDTIMHNHVDYNVRGYSEAFYHRGQDAADLLVYEQSSRNVVAYNSMTHGGDGLFLWAGQSTMDTGEGGANDNVFYGNDFSFAPANGIEATFSRNTFAANHVEGCDYGMWGGYSFDSRILGNTFLRNRTGIAIEHGQNNVIAYNQFVGDSTAVSVWAAAIEPSAWGYPRHRDTRSRGYRVDSNTFARDRVGVRAVNTSDLSVTGNRFTGVDSVVVLRDTQAYRFLGAAGDTAQRVVDTGDVHGPGPSLASWAPAPIPGGRMPPGPPLARRDRAAIIVDEWGPYDWRSPKLWPADSSRGVPMRLRVLGPPGGWRVVGHHGIDGFSRASGRTGDTITVLPERGSRSDWGITLEYVGDATVSPRGRRRKAGEPYRFSYARFEPRVDWSVRFYAWGDGAPDPRSNADAFDALVRAAPLLTIRVPRLDYEGSRTPAPGVPAERFAIEAAGAVDLAPGTYTLRTISDDCIRVWVDGILAIDDWSPHESAVDFAVVRGGHHEILVHYYQVDGWHELRLEVVRGVERSPGSPGSHGTD
jgi:parallel beta-helix repeat protein